MAQNPQLFAGAPAAPAPAPAALGVPGAPGVPVVAHGAVFQQGAHAQLLALVAPVNPNWRSVAFLQALEAHPRPAPGAGAGIFVQWRRDIAQFMFNQRLPAGMDIAHMRTTTPPNPIDACTLGVSERRFIENDSDISLNGFYGALQLTFPTELERPHIDPLVVRLRLEQERIFRARDITGEREAVEETVKRECRRNEDFRS